MHQITAPLAPRPTPLDSLIGKFEFAAGTMERLDHVPKCNLVVVAVVHQGENGTGRDEGQNGCFGLRTSDVEQIICTATRLEFEMRGRGPSHFGINGRKRCCLAPQEHFESGIGSRIGRMQFASLHIEHTENVFRIGASEAGGKQREDD